MADPEKKAPPMNMRILVTNSRARKIMAILWIALSVAVLFYSKTLHSTAPDTSAAVEYSIAFFILFVAVSLIFETPGALLPIRIIITLLLLIAALLQAAEILVDSDLSALFQGNFEAFAYTFALLFSILAFFFALTGSLLWAVCAGTLLVLLYACSNYFVLQFRGTPFIPLDITSAGTAWAVLPHYSLHISQPLLRACLLFLGIFLVAPTLKITVARKKRVNLVRVGCLAVALAFFSFTAHAGFMSRHTFSPHYWDQKISIQANGSLLNFYANIPDSWTSKPKIYSLDAVRRIAAQFPSDFISSAGLKPDVVIILGESWADLTPDGIVRTNIPVTPFISSLRKRDDVVLKDLVVYATGAGTSVAEFQLFTCSGGLGYSHPAPLQDVVRKDIPNLVMSFKQLGYDTTAIHTGTLGAWKRDKAFPLMGFDRFIAEENGHFSQENKLRGYIRDRELYKKVLSYLNASDAPQLVYAITIQTHGGYESPGYKSPVKILAPEGNFPMAEQYLGLFHEADADLEFLFRELEKRERPTIVLFFGDHTPQIEEAFLKKAESPQGIFAGYKTFFGLWANYPLPKDVMNNPQALSINYLGTYLMLKAGLPLTGYQKLMLDDALQFPVIGWQGVEDAKGRFITMDEAWTMGIPNRQVVTQYNFVIDEKNMPDNFYYLQ